MKKLVGFLLLLVCTMANAQVDTSYIYNPTSQFGALDIRISKSATDFYYLQENITTSFRESAPGVKTNTYEDMTSWDSKPYSQGNLRQKSGTKDLFIMNYRLLFPGGYNANYSKGYPMIVMMHGAGERANCWDTNCYWDTRAWKPSTNSPVAPTSLHHSLLNNDHNLTHGGSTHLTSRNLAGTKLPDDPSLNTRAFPGFVLFAQNLNGWDTYTTQDAIRIIRLALKKYNIDPNRIYVHGLSNGGSATYEVIKRAPWLFAAALPMSAITDASIFTKGMAPKVANIPIWTFQGGQDKNPLPAKTEGYVKKFKEEGAEIRYSLYPNLGHGTWNTAYAEPDFFSWILSKDKSNLHVFYGNAAICGTTNQGVKLGFAFGYLAYQWEKDGVIIEGANGAEFTANEPGLYRARFSRKSTNPSEAEWNKWSKPVTVTLNNPAQAVINPLTSTHLRGPDNAAQNTVRLKSGSLNDHYYWYKNGVLINIPSNSVDDTVSLFSLTTTSYTGNGVYTLVTKSFDNCPSPISEPLNLFFGNTAPLLDDSNIPSSFTGNALSGSSTTLNWVDNSSSEKAFEIWRKKPGESFVLAARVPANTTSFIDNNLYPSTTYNYKIRVTDNTGRSKYAPSDLVTTNLVITTDADFVPPTMPQNLTVVSNTINSITLSWTASTDNTGIKNYVVYYGTDSISTGSSLAKFTLTGLANNTNYSIKVRAVDKGNLYSTASNTVSGGTFVTGLTYGHSTGAWTDLDLITNWNTPEFTGTVTNFTLAPRTQEEFFNFDFNGYLFINTGGTYYFYLNSDDGSRLYIDGLQVVDFDGLHGTSGSNGGYGIKSAAVALDAGPHTIRVIFFEYTGGQYISVAYEGPDSGNIKMYIPDSALKSGDPSLPGLNHLLDQNVARTNTNASHLLSENSSSEFNVDVYPNPSTKDNIFVRVSSPANGPVQIRMINSLGRAVIDQSYDAKTVSDGVKLTSTESINNGIYVILVNHGNAVIKKKILIQN